MKSVKDIMSTDISFCTPNDSIVDAAKRMRDINVGAIPICSSNKELLGMVTDRDIVIRAVADGKIENVKISQVMSNELISVEPGTSIQEASDLMARHQIRRLPVVERGEIVGMIALGDLALEDKSNEAAGRALEEISEHDELH
ncbi:CBS domain-containing protein [Aquibacillus salsiterrae]|uniref:CBS domain-containing protein n=1 Tax=Aquibacillus salsiterrae TaxID=2950439 RepID=A0A9X3WE49_9BACI|nr:CBS domain-containing protein [Aquibacillus salsiterrae]MDC3416505.1 CBS domain-containing protein [Aquibacillus salsiterrae]